MTDVQPYTPPKGLFDKVRRRIAHEWPVARTNVKQPGGIISFTFDDFPKTAAQAGAEILESLRARGTYYAASSLSLADNHQGLHHDESDIRRLVENGHEVGCHTHNHHDFAITPAAVILEDLAHNAAELARAGVPQPLQSFAYPYGELTITTKMLMSKQFTSARGVRTGFNGAGADMASLRATPIENWRPDMLRQAKMMIDLAVEQGGWLIFYTHDVRENPSDYGVTPSMLKAIVSNAQESGAKIMTVGQASALVTAKAVGDSQ